MTDTDQLSTPTDMVDIVKRLTAIMREVESLPDSAQKRYWEDANAVLTTIPPEELRIGAHGEISQQSVHVLYSLLVSLCGPQLSALLNGEVKEYYEGMIAQMKEAMHDEWESLLDRKFEDPASHEGIPIASMGLRSTYAGSGLLTRVDGSPKILKLTDAEGHERYFSSKDILLIEFGPPPASRP